MSIEIDWAALTQGPDGLALAENIRSFIDSKFQQITLPRFIRSVRVHSFAFGTTGPEIVIKDICDPLPDFYEDDVATNSDEAGDNEDDRNEKSTEPTLDSGATRQERDGQGPAHLKNLAIQPSRPRPPSYIDTRVGGLRSMFATAEQVPSPSLGANTPGIPGGTSNLSYFHLPLSAGLPGTQTPLAAVAGGQMSVEHYVSQMHSAAHEPTRHPLADSTGLDSRPATAESMKSDVSDVRPESRDFSGSRVTKVVSSSTAQHQEGFREPAGDPPASEVSDMEDRALDLQVVSRVTYSGDVKLSLTAEILLDYPMPSFVGIPVRLNITGLSFDGVAILAWIKRRAHFCFVSPEDASMIAGDPESPDMLDSARHEAVPKTSKKPEVGGLLQEIKVESEIGQRENGKQSLRNVGKVEKFVLEQVRQIFEDELVYPSFWTFLI